MKNEPNKPDEHVTILDVVAISFRFRGAIIHLFSEMEEVLDNIIIEYFCQSEVRKKEMLHMVVHTKDFKFEMKKDILKHIIRHHFQKLHHKGNIITSLGKLQRMRNIVAHNKMNAELIGANKFEVTFDVPIMNDGIADFHYEILSDNKLRVLCKELQETTKKLKEILSKTGSIKT